MEELLLDSDSLNALREAIGMAELEQRFELLLQDFQALLLYANEQHTLLERLAGEPTVEASLKVSGGMGSGLRIDRNISKLPPASLATSLKRPNARNTIAITELPPKHASPNTISH